MAAQSRRRAIFMDILTGGIFLTSSCSPLGMRSKALMPNTAGIRASTWLLPGIPWGSLPPTGTTEGARGPHTSLHERDGWRSSDPPLAVPARVAREGWKGGTQNARYYSGGLKINVGHKKTSRMPRSLDSRQKGGETD